MIAASALKTGDDATPQLVTETVRKAMTRAGITQAGEVILFLTPEFSRQALAAVTAASRAAGGCLQVFGSVVAGVASDEGWAMDRPAVAALVIGNGTQATTPNTDAPAAEAAPTLSLCGNLYLPAGWREPPPRFGLLYADSLSSTPTAVWQGARITSSAAAEIRFDACSADLAVSTGVEIQPDRLRVERSASNELVRIMNPLSGLSETAAASLKRVLPVSLREQRPLPIHLASAAIHSAHEGIEPRLIPILSANADGSITLSETIPPGSPLSWALRLPAHAESDMRKVVGQLAQRNRLRPQPPAFGLFLSCIGRGPFFFAGEDRDRKIFSDSFPGLPFIGAYGSGQIAPGPTGNILLQNSVVAALFNPMR